MNTLTKIVYNDFPSGTAEIPVISVGKIIPRQLIIKHRPIGVGTDYKIYIRRDLATSYDVDPILTSDTEDAISKIYEFPEGLKYTFLQFKLVTANAVTPEEPELVFIYQPADFEGLAKRVDNTPITVDLSGLITPVNVTAGFVFRGIYDNVTDYAVGDFINYLDTSYIMYSDAAAGTLPTDTTYWQKVAGKGADGPNTVTNATTTNITGILVGDATTVGYISPNDLYVDPTTHKVGIGTTTPATKLHVNGFITSLGMDLSPHTAGSSSVALNVMKFSALYCGTSETLYGGPFLSGLNDNGNVFYGIAASGSGGSVFWAGISGEAYRRMLITANGSITWGGGLAPRDTGLNWDSAGTLKLTSNLILGHLLAEKTTGEQLRIGYDSVNYASFLVGSTGRLVIDHAVGIGIGGTPNSNAILDVQSTTKAFMPPRMTTTQKNAIASPTAGMVVYDTILNILSLFTTSWHTLNIT